MTLPIDIDIDIDIDMQFMSNFIVNELGSKTIIEITHQHQSEPRDDFSTK